MKQKKFKIADSKKLSFSTVLPKAEKLLPKFHRLVLGLAGLIDAKGISVTQLTYVAFRLSDINSKKAVICSPSFYKG